MTDGTVRIGKARSMALLLGIVILVSSTGWASSAAGGPRGRIDLKLAYLLANTDAVVAVSRYLELSSSESRRMATIVFELNGKQLAARRMPADAYNRRVHLLEEGAWGRLRTLLGPRRMERFDGWLQRQWDRDRAQHAIASKPRSVAVPRSFFPGRPAGTPYGIAGASYRTAAPGSPPTYGALTYRVFATQYDPNEAGSFEVALPDKYLKFANLGWENHQGYPYKGYRVRLKYHDRTTVAWVKDVGPWNIDDNYWNAKSQPERPRRMFRDLARGMPEAQKAYYPPHYNFLHGSITHGHDQFGRDVLNPAGIDLSPNVAQALGLRPRVENAWIDVSYLWEPYYYTSLNLTAAPTLVRYGATVPLTGYLRVKDTTRGVSGKRIRVDYRPVSSPDYRSAGTATTTASGLWRMNVVPRSHAYYRVRFAGDVTYTAANAPSQTYIFVKAKVTMTPSGSSIRYGRRIGLSGSVLWPHPGSYVYIQQKLPSGWVRIGEAKMAKDGSYGWSFRPRHKKLYLLRAHFLGDKGHGEAVSEPAKVRVK